MMWFAGGVLLFLLILCLCARKARVPQSLETSAVTRPFYRLGVWLLKFARMSRLRAFFFASNEEKLRLLDPAGDFRNEADLHFIQKVGLCSLLLAVGMAFALLMGLQEAGESLLGEDGSLTRREYGEGDYEVELDVLHGEEKESISFAVEQRAYTREEIEELLPSFRERLVQAVIGKSESADHVDADLDLVSELPDYPFYVEWETGARELLSRNGELKEGIQPEGALAELTAHITYEDYSEQYQFCVMLYPRKESLGEVFQKSLENALHKASDDSRTEEKIMLPDSVDGMEVRWTERKKSSVAVLVLLVFAAAAAIYWGKDNDLDKKVKERDEQLKADYPEMVSKLSLYIGAGMSTRIAWRKMVEEYRKKGEKRYVYEEMLLSQREMESGVGELQAYRNFGTRCRSQKYIKLVSLLEQNSKLGAGGFLASLRSECKDALQERKNNARRLGEEAGTKLLFPMMLMLAIVMVVIIVPAFSSI